ncbi:hypothetical protein [Scytonema sp. UIC 10036]|nr:hypothetical protein [Scytonema sp. UIC 10036]
MLKGKYAITAKEFFELRACEFPRMRSLYPEFTASLPDADK